MSKMYTSREQIKKLLKLGLNPETADMCWGIDDETLCYNCTPYNLPWKDYTCKEYYLPCWSLSALLELMPTCLPFDGGIVFPTFNIWEMSIEYSNAASKQLYTTRSYQNPIDAAFDMVCYLLENNYIKKEE